MDKVEIIPVKFNGTNYMYWSFHLKNFIVRQGMFGYMVGTNPKPVPDPTVTSTVDVKL